MWKRFVAPVNKDTISNGKGPPSPKGFYFLQGNQFFLLILMHIQGQLLQDFFFGLTCGAPYLLYNSYQF